MAGSGMVLTRKCFSSGLMSPLKSLALIAWGAVLNLESGLVMVSLRQMVNIQRGLQQRGPQRVFDCHQ